MAEDSVSFVFKSLSACTKADSSPATGLGDVACKTVIMSPATAVVEKVKCVWNQIIPTEQALLNETELTREGTRGVGMQQQD